MRSAPFQTHIFFHPDYTVGFGVAPNQRTQLRPVADYTASEEFHPALKTFDLVVVHIIRQWRVKSNPRKTSPGVDTVA